MWRYAARGAGGAFQRVTPAAPVAWPPPLAIARPQTPLSGQLRLSCLPRQATAAAPLLDLGRWPGMEGASASAVPPPRLLSRCAGAGLGSALRALPQPPPPALTGGRTLPSVRAATPAAANLARLLPATRGYRPHTQIPWKRVVTKIRKMEDKSRTSPGRNHNESLARFRLTRFGWERRRAGLRAKDKRNIPWKKKRAHKKIDFVHRSDLFKLERTAINMRLRIRDLPRDTNVNLKACRAIVPAHFG